MLPLWLDFWIAGHFSKHAFYSLDISNSLWFPQWLSLPFHIVFSWIHIGNLTPQYISWPPRHPLQKMIICLFIMFDSSQHSVANGKICLKSKSSWVPLDDGSSGFWVLRQQNLTNACPGNPVWPRYSSPSLRESFWNEFTILNFYMLKPIACIFWTIP